MDKNILITMGEPAGIGSEIIQKALNLYNGSAKFIILGDRRLFSNNFYNKYEFIDFNLPSEVSLKHPKKDHSKVILDIIKKSVKMCHANPKNMAMVTAPVNKEIIAEYDSNFKGHTDYIADILSKIDGMKYNPVMMLSSPYLNVVPLTVHIPLEDVHKNITREKIIKTVKIINDDFFKYNNRKPHIAISGLNPHAGDGGILGKQENEIIEPTIKELKSDYIVSGPYSADTMFHKSARDKYDIALCMYHDQALIPIKTLAFDIGVNRTIGLPIVRTSPDHGTALNIAGDDKACPKAMLEAIKTAEALLI